jgi:cytochrome c556
MIKINKNLMKNIKTYKLFLESYEEIMKNMVKDVDFSKIDSSNKEIEKIKINLENKKKELETNLENLEKLQLNTFTEDNKELAIKKKEEIKSTIEKLKLEIEKYNTDITKVKDNIQKLKDLNK